MMECNTVMTRLSMVVGVVVLLGGLSACQPPTAKINVAEKRVTPQVADQSKMVEIEIAPALVDCVGVAPMKCLQYRRVGDVEWLLHYVDIQGFTFVDGYRYTLSIREEVVSDVPADASSVRWVLQRVIAQQPVTP
ncbi:MAG: hypothetical protein RLY58_1966 [Pseudomonadota bacterium]|jgi:hypothetical protein